MAEANSNGVGSISIATTSNIVSSLTNSFALVPPAAVPAILDCVLSTTTSSSSSTITISSLFDSLLDVFSRNPQGVVKEHGGVDSTQAGYITSFITAICYLLKKSGTNPNALESFIWRGFLPAVKVINSNDHELLPVITGLFCDVVTESKTWTLIEATLIPYCLRSIRLSTGMLDTEELAVNNPLSDLGANIEQMPALCVPLPLAVACHILTSLLAASMRCNQAKSNSIKPVVENGVSSESSTRNLLSALCDMFLRMLSQNPEHRSSAIRLLLPFIIMGFSSDCCFQTSMHDPTPKLSRKHFFEKVWNCCLEMFRLGPVGRKDAYDVLSLYFSHDKGCEDDALDKGADAFDIKNKKEFWHEIKQGLVDKEGLVRKQSLHILKRALQLSDGSLCSTRITETSSNEQISDTKCITKRGQWAEKEAKSLGVGKICKPVDPTLNCQQRWEAFILLYEMLEEYGTHLVEAAWNHQISLLLHFSPELYSSVNPVREWYQVQLETSEGTFSWLTVLWERGLCHENPLVRCLIMQSFLEIEWKNHDCAKKVPESFVLGPFLQGLNDPVHHKDFGFKGSYTSKTIEGATNFMYHFSSSFSWRYYFFVLQISKF